jgi:hypothetical protein
MFASFRVSGIWVVGTLFPKGGWITQENALLTFIWIRLVERNQAIEFLEGRDARLRISRGINLTVSLFYCSCTVLSFVYISFCINILYVFVSLIENSFSRDYINNILLMIHYTCTSFFQNGWIWKWVCGSEWPNSFRV